MFTIGENVHMVVSVARGGHSEEQIQMVSCKRWTESTYAEGVHTVTAISERKEESKVKNTFITVACWSDSTYIHADPNYRWRALVGKKEN